MKKYFLLAIVFGTLSTYGQYRGGGQQESSPRFSKEKLFTGGSLNLGFASYTTNLGIAPQLGISLTDWLDAGINVNVNYAAERDYNSPAKWRKTTIGPGAFVRIFPISFLFVSAQYEYNFISLKYLPGNSTMNQKWNLEAPSFLLGVGYAGGRMKGVNTYYYFSIAGDFLGNKNSPYIDNYERMLPVIRAGYNIGLFQGRQRKF